jgi:hypothetical protein
MRRAAAAALVLGVTAGSATACTGGLSTVSDAGASGAGESGTPTSSSSGSSSGASSSGAGATDAPGGGGVDASYAASGPPIEGTGSPCAPNAQQVIGTKVALEVNWPATLNDQGCGPTGGCTGTISIWLLSYYAVNGTTLTGRVDTCGYELPPLPLSATGSQAEGLPAGQTATEQIAYLQSTWSSVRANPAKAASPATGTLGGWNVGSSLYVNPVLLTYGLQSSSPFASASQAWPCSESSIAVTDISDDDNDGHPGITAVPSAASGFSLPATAVDLTAPFAPQAGKLYMTLRTELQLYGTSTSCTDIAGGASATLLNSHVIGCELGSGAECSQSQWDFIDSNEAVYVGQGVRIPPSTCPPSFASPQIVGTFRSKILAASADGGGALAVSCADVLSALP